MFTCRLDVATLLIKVEAAVRIGYTTRACTELPCYWNNDFVKKSNQPQLTASNSTNSLPSTHFGSRTNGSDTVLSVFTHHEQTQLLDLLASCSRPPIGLSLCNGHYSSFRCKTTTELERMPQQLTTLYKLEYAGLSMADLDSQITETLSSLRVNDAEVRYVDMSTVNKAACLTLFQMRVGRIAVSRAHAVLHTRLDHPLQLQELTQCCTLGWTIHYSFKSSRSAAH